MIDCQKITNAVVDIREKDERFSHSLGKSQVEPAFEAREQLDKLARELEKEISPGPAFIEYLKEDDRISDLSAIVYNCANNSKSMPDFMKVCIRDAEYTWQSTAYKSVPFRKGIRSLQYRRFLGALISDAKIRAALYVVKNRIGMDLSKGKTGSDKDFLRRLTVGNLYNVVNSAFLNLFGRYSNFKLDAGELPENMQDFFGATLYNGEIKIKKGGELVGAHLNGGRIVAEEVGDTAGFEMKSGELVVGDAGDDFCQSMAGGLAKASRVGKSAGHWLKGGKLVLGEAGYNLGSGMEGGAIIAKTAHGEAGVFSKQGVMLVEKTGPRFGRAATGGVLINQSSSYDIGHEIPKNTNATFMTNGGGFSSALNQVPEQGFYFNGDEYLSHGQRSPNILLWEKDRLDFIKDKSRMIEVLARIIETDYKDTSITEGMKGGIMVIDGDPEVDNIGEGMTGGVVIFENAGSSVETMRQRISKKRKPGEGLILMRVIDEDYDGKSEKTKLIDLENHDQL